MPKAALHNLGCKVNAYETEAMQQQLEERGYEIVPFDQKADVYIINTCSVTNIADRKSRQMLHRAKKLNPEAVVVAAGCYVQVASDALKEDDSVDIIVGNNNKARLADILEEYMKDRQGDEDGYVLDIARAREYEELHVSRLGEHTRAFIKVQDGCNQFCSYCIIPYARGRVRSRKPEDVEAEVKGLVARGYREVVLTGIHLSSYGTEHMEGSPVKGGDWDRADSPGGGTGAHPSGFPGAENHHQGICRKAGRTSGILPSFPPLPPKRLRCHIKTHEPPLYHGGLSQALRHTQGDL